MEETIGKIKLNIKEYSPSKYQSRIYDFAQHGNGNAVIHASAGSGKSYTLLKILSFLKTDKKILFTAFNRDIVKELSGKIGRIDNVQIDTIHSIGLSMLRYNFIGKKIEVDDLKYKSYVYSNISDLSNIDGMTFQKRIRYISNILKLIDFGRVNLIENENDVIEIASNYGIKLLHEEPSTVLKVLQWGKENTDTIDYTDMIWLPYSLNLKNYKNKYDYIFIDEAQDLSKAQRELILRLRKINTRMFIAGDKDQAIYGFNGADPKSFSEFQNLENTQTFPLSITYRCADRIVEYAQKYVPTIEKNSDGRVGEIIKNGSLCSAEEGDMVLCRNNAPLIKAYSDLMACGKKCYILGKGTEDELLDLISSCKEEKINASLDEKGLISELYLSLFDYIYDVCERYEIPKKEVVDSTEFQAKYDMVKMVEMISVGVETKSELIDRIKNIFNDKNGGIRLSTIHKAKGLESDKVYIVMDSLMPSPFAKKPWEIQQEKCLQYVAYTRAKNKMIFVSEEGFGMFLHTNAALELYWKETKINKIYDIVREKDYSLKGLSYKEIVQQAKPISFVKEKENISLDFCNSGSNDAFGDINKKKKHKIKF